MEKMEEYRQKLEAQLKEWKAKIELLEDKAAKATGETRTELVRAVAQGCRVPDRFLQGGTRAC